MFDKVPQDARQGNVNAKPRNVRKDDYSRSVDWLASAITSVVPGLTYTEV